MRDKIWFNLLQAKFNAFYFDELVNRYQRLDRRLNITVALTSSGSIASWAIWDKLAILWSIIIAASSVVIVIRPYFPFNKYIKEISKKSTQSHNLHLEFEELWFNYEKEKINDDEAHQILMSLKKREVEIQNLSDDIVLKKLSIVEYLARESMEGYLKNNFNMNYNSKVE